MTDNTASPYTVPLGWADLSVGVMIELRHKTYQAVVGEVENIMPDQGEGSSVRVGGMWCFDGNGWSLWVKPEPAEPLGSVIWHASRNDEGSISVMGADIVAAAVRDAGYMTEAEWEAKRALAYKRPNDSLQVNTGRNITLRNNYFAGVRDEGSKP